jgi:hypothetical protein
VYSTGLFLRDNFDFSSLIALWYTDCVVSKTVTKILKLSNLE